MCWVTTLKVFRFLLTEGFCRRYPALSVLLARGCGGGRSGVGGGVGLVDLLLGRGRGRVVLGIDPHSIGPLPHPPILAVPDPLVARLTLLRLGGRGGLARRRHVVVDGLSSDSRDHSASRCADVAQAIAAACHQRKGHARDPKPDLPIPH